MRKLKLFFTPILFGVMLLLSISAKADLPPGHIYYYVDQNGNGHWWNTETNRYQDTPPGNRLIVYPNLPS